MAKRLYLVDYRESPAGSRIFSTPVEDSGLTADWAIVPVPHAADGTPAQGWTICLAAAADHAALRALAGVDPLPVAALSADWSSLASAQRAAILAALDRRGIARPTVAGQTFRQVLAALGRRVLPEFDPDRFDSPGQ